ncbi:MAG: phosphate ABC transporter substrate-binding protein [Anaerolineae bacterium]|nr:phosphate ABC transporter substrate-binding protein [Anaerolineae bacterium]
MSKARVWLLGLALGLMALLGGGCSAPPLPAPTHEPTVLRLVTAESCAPLAESLAAAYEESHPWVMVQTEVSNSALAERALRNGEAELALLSWIAEGSYGRERPLWAQPIARDGIAVIVHPALPLTEISLPLLRDIFRGQVQEVGGIVLAVVSREEGSGTRAVFDRVVLGVHQVTHTAVMFSSSEAVIEYVAQTPGAIGYVSTLRLDDPPAAGVRVLSVEGVLPSQAALYDGSYPLARPIYLATYGEPVGAAREFAQWAVGPEGQLIARRLR